MSRCSFVKTLFGVVSFFMLLFSILIAVEARDYHIQASDGEVYTVTLRLNNRPDVRNFSFQNANGEILRGVTEAERAIATELYFAAKLFWNVLPLFAPDSPFEDLEQEVRDYVRLALAKLTLAQMAEIFVSSAIAPLDSFVQALATGDFSLVSAVVGVLPPAINTARPLEPERQLVETASILAIACGRATSNFERLLNQHWTSYETRKGFISIDEINATWESFHKYIQYRFLAAELMDTYLKHTDLKERLVNTTLGTVAGRIIVPAPIPDIPVAGGAISVTPIARLIVSSVTSTILANRAINVLEAHIQHLKNLAKEGDSRIQKTALLDIAEGKKQSRTELEQNGFFQPSVVVPLEDVRISVDDGPQTLDVRDYFSPTGNNLTYIARSSNLNVALARTERTGSSVISITPKAVGSASVVVEVIGLRGLSVTESFTVTVVQDTQHVQRPEPHETIDHQLLLMDGSTRTLDIAPYFSWNNPLNYEVSASPPGIVAASVSGSRVTLTPRQLGNASVVVRASDRTDRNLYAIQTIPVIVYTNRATIVRPPTPATFTPPATSNPAVEGLRKGVSVITQLDPGFTLNIRTEPGTNSDIVDVLGSGVTGTLIDGPRKNGGFTWWKVRWDASRLEGWSVEADRGQILFRRPPDLKILSLKASEDEVRLGETCRLEAEVHNNGPGESAATEIYFYYSQNRHSSLEALNRDGNLRIAGRGTVEVSALGEDKSRKVSLTVEAPADPDTYYYGALLRSNILETDYTEDLDPDFLRNNLAREVDIKVRSAPDLIVESISANKSILDPGESFTLETTIRNQGIGAPERSARLRYYRSFNADISTRDTEVDSNSISSRNLGTNGIGEESIRLRAPSQPGVYYYGACVELRDEEDTDNNCSGAVSITVRETGVSDLVVSLPTLSHQTIGPGESFMLESTVHNQGDGTASSTTFRGYQSDNTSISSNDTEIGSVQVSSLTADTTELQQLSLTAPLAAGTYYYGVAIDSVEKENNTANNRSASVALNVENRAPVALKAFPLQALVVGNATVVDVAPYFSDPNEDILTYYVFSDAVSVVVGAFSELSNSELALTPLAAGNATITVEISDGEFTATQTIDVSVTSSSVSEETWMPDVNLRAAVRNALGLAAGEVLTQEAIQGLIFLEASGPLNAALSEKIQDLTGLEHAMQLAVLSLRHNEIVDVSVVSGLTQLILLDIRGNKVIDVRPLSDLTQLTELSLDGNPIADLAPLRRLKAKNPDVDIDIDIGVEVSAVSEEIWMPDANLRAAVREALGLAPNDALTQQAMQGLTILRYWGYLNNNKKIADLTGLESATNLTELGLSGNQIVDATPLANLKKLTILYLSGNQIVDATPLANLKNLTELALDDNQVVDITPLANLNNLAKLELQSNQIVDATPLANLKNLIGLYLSDNQVVDITPLANLNNLAWLDLSDNQVVDITPLANLNNLAWLDLQSNQIVDITPLTNLNNLTALALGGNQIVDITPLANLNNLTELGLHSNQIVDVTPLTNLNNLTWLFLVGNPIADLAPLRRLKAKNLDVEIDIDIGAVITAVSEEKWMPDANLRAAVREALELARDDVLTQEAMIGLTKLNASVTEGTDASKNIKDPTGLEHATRLTWLDLSGTIMEDMSPLSGLTQLTWLDLTRSGAVNLSPLSGLTQLTELYLYQNGVVDLSPLSSLTQLRILNVSNLGMSVGVVDLSPLSNLTQLRELSLDSNKVVDLSPLSGLTQLEKLVLHGNEIVDVSPLSSLTQLTHLYLGGNEIANLSPLSGLTQLEKLDLGGNEIVDISALSGLIQLTELSLGGNGISNISPLSGLTQLTELYLWYNEISNISPLSGMTQLTVLRLGDNEIVDVSPLSGLSQLAGLHLTENQISDVSALEGLVNLGFLSLKENPISDFAPLRRLKSKNPDMDIDIDISVKTPVISGGDAAFHLYWTLFNRGEIQRSNLDGTRVRTLFTKLTHPINIAVDIAGGKIYWATFSPDKIQRANLDGTNIQDIATDELLGPADIALDVAGGKIYWTNDNYSGDGKGDKIQRANLDGSNVQDIVTEGLSYLNGIALDVTRKKIYWTNLYKIQRANLDGSNVQDIFVNSGSYNLFGIALDVAGGKVYWGNSGKHKIQRANLDGSNVEDIVTGVKTYSIALDVAGGKVYWVNPSKSKIQRANLDGTNIQDIVTGVKTEEIALGTFSQNLPPVVREDVNRDGVIDLQDTAVVRANLGQIGQNDADVNGDDVVDVDDLVLVLAAIENAAAAPTARTQIQQLFTAKEVQQWLTETQLSEDTSPAYLRGITMLEQILALLIPQETALFANYPNPFNPETWIPYQLSKPTDVTVSIYSVDGKLVRTLALGHQSAGVYQNKSRAAYWDGRNDVGERVASGVYFYTFTAGSFTATQKMLIRK